jgi:hypothetical protein
LGKLEGFWGLELPEAFWFGVAGAEVVQAEDREVDKDDHKADDGRNHEDWGDEQGSEYSEWRFEEAVACVTGIPRQGRRKGHYILYVLNRL